MDFLEKLDYLMECKHLNKSTLSKACDIPYTTIDGWYKRGYEGLKLPTLRKLSDYFGISLDYWADDNIKEPLYRSADSLNLTNDETTLIENYRLLPNESKEDIQKSIEKEVNFIKRLLQYQRLINSKKEND